jgi:hypothetical protein
LSASTNSGFNFPETRQQGQVFDSTLKRTLSWHTGVRHGSPTNLHRSHRPEEGNTDERKPENVRTFVCWDVPNVCPGADLTGLLALSLIDAIRVDFQRIQTAACVGSDPRTIVLIHVDIELFNTLEIGDVADVHCVCNRHWEAYTANPEAMLLSLDRGFHVGAFVFFLAGAEQPSRLG